MKDNILYLEGTVLAFLTKHEFILYNLLERKGSLFSIENERTYEIFEALTNIDNGYSIYINPDDLKYSDLAAIIKFLKENYWGDYITIKTNTKPITFFPVTNLEKAKFYVINTLNTITIAVNSIKSSCNFEIQNQIPIEYESVDNKAIDIMALTSFLSRLKQNIKINIIGGNILSHERISELFSYIKNFDNYTIYTDAQYYSNKLPEDNLSIIFRYPYTDIIPIYKERKNQKGISFIFLVLNEFELTYAIDLEETIKDIRCYIWPFYNGMNINFFRDYVYIDKTSILKEEFTKQQYFSNRNINSHFYGKLFISPDGHIQTNYNLSSIGDLDTSLDVLLSNANHEDQAWNLIRQKEPCLNCVFKWICPPISNYEICMKKYDMCN